MPKNDILDTPILWLSDKDYLELRGLCEGTLITGAPGSGKTTTSGKKYAFGLLSVPGMGGLILTAKPEETRTWIGYAKACGREKDLIVFNAESGHCFDPLHYEWTRPGRGAGDLESIIDFFSTLSSIGKKEVGRSHDPFWERGNEQLMRNIIKLLDLAGERISIVNIDRAIKSLPSHLNEHEEQAYQERAYCAQLLKALTDRKDTLTPEQWDDLDFATQFIFRKWPSFDERPRSSLDMTWSGMADIFLFHPFNRLFCGGKCTFRPEDTMNGKLILCDFPMLEYGHETGRLINIILKLIFQRAWLRRDVSQSPNPVFLWQDEFQYFVTRRDNFFQQTCRGSRVAVVCLTQNILNLSEELGEDQPGSKTKSFCGNLAVKIAHQQNEPDTSTFIADIIGKEYRYLDSYNAGGTETGRANASVGGSQQLVHIIQPVEFTRLIKPDANNPYAEAIVYQSKPFNVTKTERNPKGSNYLRVLFSRD